MNISPMSKIIPNLAMPFRKLQYPSLRFGISGVLASAEKLALLSIFLAQDCPNGPSQSELQISIRFSDHQAQSFFRASVSKSLLPAMIWHPGMLGCCDILEPHWKTPIVNWEGKLSLLVWDLTSVDVPDPLFACCSMPLRPHSCAGGWFHTGDQGFLDKDGYVHLTGRIKELINRGGEKISPVEVCERAHAQHGSVLKCQFALIGQDGLSCWPPRQRNGHQMSSARIRQGISHHASPKHEQGMSEARSKQQ